MSKPIEVHRHFNMIEMSQEDPEVKAWFGESYKPIGPYMEGKVVGSGLSFDEQKLLLPEYLGIEPTDKDFRTRVNNFYHGFLYKVDKNGLKLEVGLADDNQELSETNMPLVLDDYIKYRHLSKHPHVKANQYEAEKDPTAKFYIVDKSQIAKAALSTNSLEDKALELYMRFKDDNIKVDQVLTMLGVNTANLKKDKILIFKERSKRNPALKDTEQKEALQKFITTCEDTDLEMKYLIEESIGFEYLKRVGSNVLFAETGKSCGVNLADAVEYFKNPKNSRELNLLKAQYEMKSKKARISLPKEKEVEAE